MIRGIKFGLLLEECQKDMEGSVIVQEARTGRNIRVTKKGKPLKTFEVRVRESLGLSTDKVGNMVIDQSKKQVNARDVDFTEIMQTFLQPHYGRNITEGDIHQAMGTIRLAETGGGAPLGPSAMLDVNAFRSSVFGLLDALAAEPAEEVDYLSERLIPTRQVNTNGGYYIGARGESDLYADPLEEGEAAPLTGIKPSKIKLPEQYRRGKAVKITSHMMKYDRTTQIQEAVDKAGTGVKFQKEKDVAQCVMGIVNTFEQDGKTANTYQDAATDAPNTYVNTSINALSSYTDINDALTLLRRIRDPYTGRPVGLKAPYTLIVSPDEQALVSSIVRSTMTRQVQDGADQRYGANPLQYIPEVPLLVPEYNEFWWDVLKDSAGTSDAINNWFMGNFSKAFEYLSTTPFSGVDDPSEVSPRHDVIMCRVFQLWGRPAVKNPRYAYRGTAD